MDRDEAAKTSTELQSLFEGVALSDNTRRLYVAQWRKFVGWCAARPSLALPARPRLLILYLAMLAEERLSASTLKVACNAIAKAHELRGHVPPMSHPLVMTWLRRLTDTCSHEPQRTAGLTAAQLRQIVAAMGDDLAAFRDRALLLVGFAARLRPAELVELNVADVVRRGEGIELLVPARRILIAPGRDPITSTPLAVCSWIDAAAPVPSGPLFVGINRWGQRGGRLSERGVTLIVQARARKAGLSIAGISADSLHLGSRDERRLL
ncbi:MULTISPECIES: tyrosine-type recombinase/integrase [Sorangium]|uniref:Integrase-like protein n=1 Tax=Sorangium cellulosum (strain So ce56) TaxID=448385 RepID=A9F6J9_SORC5|nr:integrase [Sorangium cellulosum]CAN91442.1 Integrase-like protein [Sorangium cellulosum So ce56]